MYYLSHGLFVSMANIPRVPRGHELVYWPIGTKVHEIILDKVDIASMHHKECDFHVHFTVHKCACSSGVNMMSSIYKI